MSRYTTDANLADLQARLRGLADRLAQEYGDPNPPEDDLSVPDHCYFVMHEAAQILGFLIEERQQ
jgi:hypothetical protein